MTKEDIEFERFQTMVGALLEEELSRIIQTGKTYKMQTIVGMITKNYAHLEKKINFNQNLRSREDYTYRHSLNVAILCAMLSHTMNIRIEEQLWTITAALVHDMGKMTINKELADCDELTEEERMRLTQAEVAAYDIIDSAFVDGTHIRRICAQSQKVLLDAIQQKHDTQAMKMMTGSKILAVAGMYDSLTAMQLGKEPMSEIKALKYLMDNPDFFDPEVVMALVRTINFLVPGISVELNNGDKALVIMENMKNILRPMILNFRNNQVLDLSDDIIFEDIWIEDVMKTMDNRYIMDIQTLRACGYIVEEPEYVK
jgi:HD-GYP domain-containing protein (c-di-GMP phosphodiesterase class II)